MNNEHRKAKIEEINRKKKLYRKILKFTTNTTDFI